MSLEPTPLRGAGKRDAEIPRHTDNPVREVDPLPYAGTPIINRRSGKSAPTMNTTIAGTIKVLLSAIGLILGFMGLETDPETGKVIINASTPWLVGALFILREVLSWVQAKLSADAAKS